MPDRRLHECPLCDAKFLTELALRGHQVVHSENGHPMQTKRGEQA